MMAVVVLAEFFANGLQLRLVRAEVHRGHRLEIRRVEAWGEDCVLHRVLHRNG